MARRDQPQPEAGEVRRQQRNREHHARQPALPCVLPHQVAVAGLVRAADLEDAALAIGESQSRHQVRQQIVDADRLRQRRDPPRADHDRQTFHQRTNELE
jgi:hypothetical protein